MLGLLGREGLRWTERLRLWCVHGHLHMEWDPGSGVRLEDGVPAPAFSSSAPRTHVVHGRLLLYVVGDQDGAGVQQVRA